MLDNDNIIITNPTAFARIKAKLIADGISNLQVVSDFDRTLTKAVVNGKEGASTYGVIEHSGLLSPEYHKKIREYFNQFYPIEIDPHMPIEEKTPHMIEWYRLANQLLISEKMSVFLFEEMIAHSNIGFRERVHEFLVLLEEYDIPLLVFSAGIGDLIDKIFVHFEGRIFKNIHVVSNRIMTDENGIINGFKEPVIHVFNKNEMALSRDGSASWFESVSHRKNMILLGDSPGDVGMAVGLSNPGVILKIGFLNSNIEANLPKYRELFDVLIINDGTFDFAKNLLVEIKQNK